MTGFRLSAEYSRKVVIFSRACSIHPQSRNRAFGSMADVAPGISRAITTGLDKSPQPDPDDDVVVRTYIEVALSEIGVTSNLVMPRVKPFLNHPHKGYA